MLESMKYTLHMDRTFLPEEHYVVPGRFVLEASDEEIFFDFCETSKNCDGNNVTYKHVSLEINEFPEASKLTVEIMENCKFKEFFIYTGDSNDAEINILKVSNLEFGFDDGTILKAGKKLLESANETLVTE